MFVRTGLVEMLHGLIGVHVMATCALRRRDVSLGRHTTRTNLMKK